MQELYARESSNRSTGSGGTWPSESIYFKHLDFAQELPNCDQSCPRAGSVHAPNDLNISTWQAGVFYASCKTEQAKLQSLDSATSSRSSHVGYSRILQPAIEAFFDLAARPRGMTDLLSLPETPRHKHLLHECKSHLPLHAYRLGYADIFAAVPLWNKLLETDFWRFCTPKEAHFAEQAHPPQAAMQPLRVRVAVGILPRS